MSKFESGRLSSPPPPTTDTPPLGPGALQGNSAFATSVALLFLRLALGWVFVYHGSQKCFGAFEGMGMEAWTKFLEGQHLPILPAAAWAYMAAYAEFLGGALVAIGLAARLASLPIIAVMLVAMGTATGKNGFDMMKHGYEYNVVLTAMGLAILLAGPGLISADAILFRRSLWARGPQPLGAAARRG